MLSSLGSLWRWWVDSWSSPRRARLTYIAMAVAFAALAIAGIVIGNYAVGGVAVVVTVATAVLAYFAPRLSRLTGPRKDVR